jgi:integrase
MASLQKKGLAYYCQFLYQGRRRTVTVGKVSENAALAFAERVEELLDLIARRLITVPSGVDIAAFVANDGKVEETPASLPQAVPFAAFSEKYLATHRGGAMEENSLATVAMHLKHFQKTLGASLSLRDLTTADLQRHIDRRRQTRYRGKLLSPVTLKKEMASFRAAWNWAVTVGLTSGPFPGKGLVYPKCDEKPPFQTWREIERCIGRGGLTAQEEAALWECLFLTQADLTELLAFVKSHALHGWVYPALTFAAHTGARRSEVCRVRLQDLDLEGETVLIHEKKRRKGMRTTRRVPLSRLLKEILQDWLVVHPGGQYLFCHRDLIPRSRTRSLQTGYLGRERRPTTIRARMATVRRRQRPALRPLTKNEANDHFKRTLAESKWQVLRGWHVLRHSFISICASRGVDQRLIDSWVGHQTEEMRKRYRHLIPSTEKAAICSVFG